MNEETSKPIDDVDNDTLRSLKRLTAIVYLCQVLAFAFAGLPLLIGVVINFLNRNDAQGTWLESHFDWQIQTVWIALAGLALSGLTFEFGIGVFILISTLILLIYRIVIGWNALNADKPVAE
ncbi:MAG: hypothetical protein Q8Q50_15290 [Methylobacter sp.]|nr:hypothetical protein [Methylobacter sp.]